MDSVPWFCIKPIQKDKKVDALKGNIVPKSRNITLFNEGRFFAYKNVSGCKSSDELFEKVFNHILQLNETEAKSITRWVWKKRKSFTPKRWNTNAMGIERMKNLLFMEYIKETERIRKEDK